MEGLKAGTRVVGVDAQSHLQVSGTLVILLHAPFSSEKNIMICTPAFFEEIEFSLSGDSFD